MERPIAASWSQKDLNSYEYSITDRTFFFMCCNSSFKYISWDLKRWLKVVSKVDQTTCEKVRPTTTNMTSSVNEARRRLNTS
jgi:hypothetical protein